MLNEEFKEISMLLKLSGEDEALKKDAEDYIKKAKAVLLFSGEEKEMPVTSKMRPDDEESSVPRNELLRNSKGVSGGYFCLPERRERS